MTPDDRLDSTAFLRALLAEPSGRLVFIVKDEHAALELNEAVVNLAPIMANTAIVWKRLNDLTTTISRIHAGYGTLALILEITPKSSEPSRRELEFEMAELLRKELEDDITRQST